MFVHIYIPVEVKKKILNRCKLVYFPIRMSIIYLIHIYAHKTIIYTYVCIYKHVKTCTQYIYCVQSI